MVQISIIKLKQLEGASRLDSEYYLLEYLELYNYLQKGKKIIDISRTVDLQSNGAFKKIFEILNDDNPKVVPYIRSENVGDFFVNKEKLIFISQEAHNKLTKTKTKIDDILMARKGKIGGASIVTKDCENFNSNDNVVNIRISEKSILPEYFVTFFNTKFGLKQVMRLATGNVQPWLSMQQVRELLIVILPMEIQVYIKRIVNEAYELDLTSRDIYNQASSLLLKNIGLDTLKTDKQLCYISKFNKILKSNRFDAEYYQPKYDAIIERTSKQASTKKLGELVKIRKGVEVGSEAYQDNGIPFIRVSNLTKFGINDNNQKFISEELYLSLKRKFQPKKGEILLSKDGTPGIAFLIEEEKDLIISGGILRLKINEDIDENYLTLVLNSLFVQSQIERDSGGSIIIHWRPELVKNTLIPLLSKNKQEKISELIEESFESRKTSKQLVEKALKQVEEEIEEH